MTSNEQPEKLDLRSHTITEDKKQELLQLFPEIRTEKGKIDFDRLKLTLGETVDVGRERYGMNWPGKADCFKTIQQPSMGTMLPCREESVDFDTTENLIIEGDNLEVLKLLQKSYLGKVKMIYIDPPYNTGNDFIYPDNYTESLQTYLEYTGQVDNEGRKFSTNTEADGRFHSKWMNMMYPRLYLARNLLSNDGIIFISIDDCELVNAKNLCNEVFGEEAFIGVVNWRRRQVADNRNLNNFSIDHEYVLVVGKVDSVLLGEAKDLTKYSNPDNDPRGPWMSDNLTGLANAKERPNLHYIIINPNTGISYPPLASRGWCYEESRMKNMILENRILWPTKPDGRPRLKHFLKEIRSQFTGFSSIQEPGYTTDGTRELEMLFGEKIFGFPKPVKLITTLASQALSSDDIILDFFAGSGTTAHAVLDLNKQDGGNRKFILVQLPEPTGRSDYKTIADITKERVRRVIKNINHEMHEKREKEKKEQEEKKNIGEQVSIFTDSDSSSHSCVSCISWLNPDLGFKVFKLSESSFKSWNHAVPAGDVDALAEQLELHIDHIKQGRTQEDILYEILLKSGFPLSTKIEKITLAEKTVYSVSDNEMFICLEHNLTFDLIKTIADRKPYRVVFLDEGFTGNDQLKTNAVQTMKAKGVIKFWTV